MKRNIAKAEEQGSRNIFVRENGNKTANLPSRITNPKNFIKIEWPNWLGRKYRQLEPALRYKGALDIFYNADEWHFNTELDFLRWKQKPKRLL